MDPARTRHRPVGLRRTAVGLRVPDRHLERPRGPDRGPAARADHAQAPGAPRRPDRGRPGPGRSGEKPGQEEGTTAVQQGLRSAVHRGTR